MYYIKSKNTVKTKLEYSDTCWICLKSLCEDTRIPMREIFENDEVLSVCQTYLSKMVNITILYLDHHKLIRILYHFKVI